MHVTDKLITFSTHKTVLFFKVLQNYFPFRELFLGKVYVQILLT